MSQLGGISVAARGLQQAQNRTLQVDLCDGRLWLPLVAGLEAVSIEA
jgi:hypothetical protein